MQDKIEELREAMAELDVARAAVEKASTIQWNNANRRCRYVERRFERLSANYVRSILNSPDEAAVERALDAYDAESARLHEEEHGGTFCRARSDENRAHELRLFRAALTAALGVAAPDKADKCSRCNGQRTVVDAGVYPERMPCPACTDGTWADTKPAPPDPTDQPVTGDGAEDVVERLVRKHFPSAGGELRHNLEQLARAALATAVVPGMVMVPREPTEAMVQAYAGAMNASRHNGTEWTIRDAYRAMIAAVPTPEGE